MSTQSPLRCREAAQYLSAFVDGELAEPLQSALATHITTCQTCQARVAAYRQTDRLLQRLPRTQPSAQVFEQIQLAIQEQADPQAERAPLRPGRRAEVLRRRLIAVSTQASAPVVVQPASRRGRLLAGALPTVAALLLISLAVIAFSRVRTQPMGQVTGTQPSSFTSTESVLQQTQREVSALEPALGFRPPLPSYLPSGARLGSVLPSTVTGAGGSRTYVDITWTFRDGAVCQLHLRETPESLGWVGYAPTQAASITPWQLPGKPEWQPLNLLTNAQQPAMGQDRSAFRIAADVAPCDPTDTSDTDIAALRLVSLSIDAPYWPLSLNSAQLGNRVLHFVQVVTTATGALLFRRDVYSAPDASQQRIETSGPAGQPLTSTFIHGTQATQIDYADSRLFVGAASDVGGAVPLPNSRAMLAFTQPNTLASQAELWNLGVTTFHQARVYAFALVTSPVPATVYVDAATQQPVAASVASSTALQPASADQNSWFPALPCGTYMLIEYVSDSAGFFSAPSSTYPRGAPASALACPT
jgi:anti-sigma factor RsiW